MSIKTKIETYYEEARALRQSIHEEPELYFTEFKTSQKVQDFLTKHGIPFKSGIAKTGILATIDSGKPGPTILLRADMDALPIHENPNNKPYVSKIDGIMHACGHDGHTSGLCLAGAVLNDLKDQFSGKIKLMFQPAEEFMGGAEPMIREGILDGVDMAFGAHLWGSSPEGVIGTKAGALMAAPDNFDIKVIGKGGHGSTPEVCIDPIVCAAQIVLALQTLVSRKLDPQEACVLSVCEIKGGSAYNIIPNEVTLKGTVRTLNPKVREMMPGLMKECAEKTAEAMGARAEFVYTPYYPILINDEKATEIAFEALEEFMDSDKVIRVSKAVMGGEDFAYIAQNVPSCFIFVGTMEDKPVSHHHPDYTFRDENLKILSESLVRCALKALQNLA